MVLNKGFLEHNIKKEMEREGIDTAHFDEHDIDSTLTYSENLRVLRGKYGIKQPEDRDEAQLARYEAMEEAEEADKQKELHYWGYKKEPEEKNLGWKHIIIGGEEKIKSNVPVFEFVGKKQKEKVEDYGAVERINWGFMSKVGGGKEKERQKKLTYSKLLSTKEGRMKRYAKPGIVKYLPKTISVKQSFANLLGVPSGFGGGGNSVIESKPGGADFLGIFNNKKSKRWF